MKKAKLLVRHEMNFIPEEGIFLPNVGNFARFLKTGCPVETRTYKLFHVQYI
jgi:hypothetical protein